MSLSNFSAQLSLSTLVQNLLTPKGTRVNAAITTIIIRVTIFTVSSSEYIYPPIFNPKAATWQIMAIPKQSPCLNLMAKRSIISDSTQKMSAETRMGSGRTMMSQQQKKATMVRSMILRTKRSMSLFSIPFFMSFETCGLRITPSSLTWEVEDVSRLITLLIIIGLSSSLDQDIIRFQAIRQSNYSLFPRSITVTVKYDLIQQLRLHWIRVGQSQTIPYNSQ